MEQGKRILILALLAAAVVVGANFYTLHGIRDQLYQYEERFYELENKLVNARNSLADQYSSLRHLIEQESSLFSSTSVGMALKDGKIAVTVKAVPKQLATGEQMFVQIESRGQLYEAQADEKGCAELLVELTQSVQPVLVIRSSEGVRQEQLREYTTMDLLSVSADSAWEQPDGARGGKEILTLSVFPSQNPLPFDADQIQEAFLPLVSTKSGPSGETSPASPVTDASAYGFASSLPEGEKIPAAFEKTTQDKSVVRFSADFSSLYARQDGIQYEVYFSLITSDGTAYTSAYNSVASFSVGIQSSSSSQGDCMLLPILS